MFFYQRPENLPVILVVISMIPIISISVMCSVTIMPASIIVSIVVFISILIRFSFPISRPWSRSPFSVFWASSLSPDFSFPLSFSVYWSSGVFRFIIATTRGSCRWFWGEFLFIRLCFYWRWTEIISCNLAFCDFSRLYLCY